MCDVPGGLPACLCHRREPWNGPGAPANFQADDIGSYALFFERLVAKLEKTSAEMQGTIEAECREVLELAGERIFTNLHLRDASFPFEEVLRKPEPEEAAKASRQAVADHVVAFVNMHQRGPADDEGTSQASLSAASSSSAAQADSEA